MHAVGAPNSCASAHVTCARDGQIGQKQMNEWIVGVGAFCVAPGPNPQQCLEEAKRSLFVFMACIPSLGVGSSLDFVRT